MLANATISFSIIVSNTPIMITAGNLYYCEYSNIKIEVEECNWANLGTSNQEVTSLRVHLLSYRPRCASPYYRHELPPCSKYQILEHIRLLSVSCILTLWKVSLCLMTTELLLIEFIMHERGKESHLFHILVFIACWLPKYGTQNECSFVSFTIMKWSETSVSLLRGQRGWSTKEEFLY